VSKLIFATSMLKAGELTAGWKIVETDDAMLNAGVVMTGCQDATGCAVAMGCETAIGWAMEMGCAMAIGTETAAGIEIPIGMAIIVMSGDVEAAGLRTVDTVLRTIRSDRNALTASLLGP
jgi:hypothetical protein